MPSMFVVTCTTTRFAAASRSAPNTSRWCAWTPDSRAAMQVLRVARTSASRYCMLCRRAAEKDVVQRPAVPGEVEAPPHLLLDRAPQLPLEVEAVRPGDSLPRQHH